MNVLNGPSLVGVDEIAVLGQILDFSSFFASNGGKL
jgi:hypothetical protein